MTEYQYFDLSGSLDLSTPALSLKPGMAIEAVNHEPGISGGFRRIAGHERFDGRQRPSDGTFYRLEVGDTTGINQGNVLTGSTSGATAYVLGTDAPAVFVTGVTGDFQEGESVGTTTVTGEPVERDVSTSEEEQLYLNLAADYYRDQIGQVPGDGQIRGVWMHNDTLYAWRDDGAVCKLYKSTASGWSLISFYHYLVFDTGTSEIADGDEITNGTAMATVKRVMTRSGTWSGGDMEGYLVIEPISGTFAASDTIKVGATSCATAVEDAAEIVFTAGGRFEMISHNFLGESSGYRVYGCNGLDPAFEIDQNEIVTPLFSKAETDNPAFVTAYKSRLFLGQANGGVQFSVVGTPHSYVVSLGAGSLSLGAKLTGMKSQPGGLVLTSTRQTFILEGSSVADFSLNVVSEATGATPYTLQALSRIYALDDRGVTQLDRANVFGNFEAASISRNIQPLVRQLQGMAVASTVIRTTNQYRLYFSNGTGFAMVPMETQNGTYCKSCVVDYGKAVRVVCNAEDSSGNERIFFGSDDGYVYEDQRGTSFDGEPIEAWVRIAFNHMKSPRVRKRWRKAVFELDGEGHLEISVTPDLSYSSANSAAGVTQAITVAGGGGYWDTDSWEGFSWDAQTVSAAEVKLYGTGTNLGLLIHSFSDEFSPFTLQGVIVHFEKRRLER